MRSSNGRATTIFRVAQDPVKSQLTYCNSVADGEWSANIWSNAIPLAQTREDLLRFCAIHVHSPQYIPKPQEVFGCLDVRRACQVLPGMVKQAADEMPDISLHAQ